MRPALPGLSLFQAQTAQLISFAGKWVVPRPSPNPPNLNRRHFDARVQWAKDHFDWNRRRKRVVFLTKKRLIKMGLTGFLTTATISARRKGNFRPVKKVAVEPCFGPQCPTMGYRVLLLFTQQLTEDGIPGY